MAAPRPEAGAAARRHPAGCVVKLESWDVTSDSLAAWPAARIGLRRLVLVKSAAVPEDAAATALVESGLVDPVLPQMLRAGRVAGWCIHAGAAAAFAAALANGRIAGSRIRLDG